MVAGQQNHKNNTIHRSKLKEALLSMQTPKFILYSVSLLTQNTDHCYHYTTQTTSSQANSESKDTTITWSMSQDCPTQQTNCQANQAITQTTKNTLGSHLAFCGQHNKPKNSRTNYKRAFEWTHKQRQWDAKDSNCLRIHTHTILTTASTICPGIPGIEHKAPEL